MIDSPVLEQEKEDAVEEKKEFQEALETIRISQQNRIELYKEKENILAKVVVARLRWKLEDLQNLILEAGAYRNKTGNSVILLNKALDKIDAVLSNGNPLIAQKRKECVKKVQSELKRADQDFERSKQLVEFVQRVAEDINSRKIQKTTSVVTPEPQTAETKNSEKINSISGINNTIEEEEQEEEEEEQEEENSPIYRILDSDSSVNIEIVLPENFRERDLRFEPRKNHILRVHGFSTPLDFSIDPRRCAVEETVYRITKSGLLILTIPKRILKPKSSPIPRRYQSFLRPNYYYQQQQPMIW